MPELGEVSFYLQQWAKFFNQKVTAVKGNSSARVFRDSSLSSITKQLKGKKLRFAQRRAKWACFRFDTDTWLSVHLGMTGHLKAVSTKLPIEKHEHLQLYLDSKIRLSFVDPRMFGGLLLDVGTDQPKWWKEFPLEVTEKKFNYPHYKSFVNLRANPPLKGFLLDQKKFPGIGNWMADEILWRAQLNPHRKIKSLNTLENKKLFKEILFVAKYAEKKISKKLDDIPESWLFHHRWTAQLPLCPKTKTPLVRDTISGRSSIWSPAWQN